jgi:hypothetical protein
MPAINPVWVKRAYLAHVDDWLWPEWGYARGWSKHLPAMILWYSVAGLAFLGEPAADSLLESARNGRPLPRQRRRIWTAAQKLAREISELRGTNPIDWFTGGCGDLEVAWKALDDIPGIGPKITSFIMRDLSFMRDYSRGLGGRAVSYRSSAHRGWFEALPCASQALFMPIDKHVHSAACQYGVGSLFEECSLSTIQSDPQLHQRAATAIVQWSRARGLDPRDVDVYWYLTGQGALKTDGTAA